MSDRLTLAQLNGTAHRLLRERADVDTCLRELHAISSDPETLGTAAGIALGASRQWDAGSHVGHDGDRVARMLTAAGGAGGLGGCGRHGGRYGHRYAAREIRGTPYPAVSLRTPPLSAFGKSLRVRHASVHVRRQ